MYGTKLLSCKYISNSISGVHIDVKNTQELISRLDKLVIKLENTEESKKIYRRYNALLEEIKKNLPEDKQDLTRRLDDVNVELLILYEEFFYKKGHYDRPEFKSFFRKLKMWLFGC